MLSVVCYFEALLILQADVKKPAAKARGFIGLQICVDFAGMSWSRVQKATCVLLDQLETCYRLLSKGLVGEHLLIAPAPTELLNLSGHTPALLSTIAGHKKAPRNPRWPKFLQTFWWNTLQPHSFEGTEAVRQERISLTLGAKTN